MYPVQDPRLPEAIRNRFDELHDIATFNLKRYSTALSENGRLDILRKCTLSEALYYIRYNFHRKLLLQKGFLTAIIDKIRVCSILYDIEGSSSYYLYEQFNGFPTEFGCAIELSHSHNQPVVSIEAFGVGRCNSFNLPHGLESHVQLEILNKCGITLPINYQIQND